MYRVPRGVVGRVSLCEYAPHPLPHFRYSLVVISRISGVLSNMRDATTHVTSW